MKVTRKSPFSGEVHTLEIPCTIEQIERWHDGELIQNVMPEISAELREFIMTGITPEEWNTYIGSDDGDEIVTEVVDNEVQS